MTEFILDNDWLECPICLETFDDTCKMLPCQHTFHKQCLQDLHTNDGKLICPQCRLFVSNDIESLPKNYFLLGVLEKAKSKSSESENHESAELQYALDRSKSEADIKAREQELLVQKENVEFELMRLRSSQNGNHAAAAAESQLASECVSSASYSGCTSEEAAAENDCCSPAKEACSDRWRWEMSRLVDNLEGLGVCDAAGAGATAAACGAVRLEPQAMEGFQTLNVLETHASLTGKMLQIVRAADDEALFNDIDVEHLIDYDDLIGEYLQVLAECSSENSFSCASTSQPKCDDVAAAGCSAGIVSNCGSPAQSSPFLTSCSASCDDSYVPDILPAPTNYALPVEQQDYTTTPSDYQLYSFDDDDRNLKLAMELSRQNVPEDDLLEEVLQKSKIAHAIDEQKKLFLAIREKVEYRIALLMSQI